eukprot:CAMPEP_0116130208 /NCGR_PEP_ID=MMETSP0329-20121206/8336_1 /TAXON_ID=697910 /ORGANISM="Pseudo-nitzschia arenysensis, Strain B593" /LENGTH=765 /DNA_ID=CAMNT_0003624529 /DNA_START=101 /DNA_END=2395 /DNA_ORIENTATION=+
MVKPRDQDVVFVEDLAEGGGNANEDADDSTSDDPFTTPQKKQKQVSSPPSSETSGNRIYKRLLREYYDQYFHGDNSKKDTPGSSASCCSLEQKKIRRLLLEQFHQEMAATTSPAANSATVTTPNSASSSPSKPQFLLHRKQGKSSCFSKVFFNAKKESFESMRRDHGENIDLDDCGPVGVITTPINNKSGTSLRSGNEKSSISKSSAAASCSSMTSRDVAALLAMRPDIRYHSKDKGESDDINQTEECSTNSQAAGCETGEAGDPSSQKLAERTRKCRRKFLWKDTSTSEPNSRGSSTQNKKAKLDHDTERVNKSNWGKLQELLGFVRPQKSFTEENEMEGKMVDSITANTSLTAQIGDTRIESNSGGSSPMTKILVSPYEANRSAEIGEEPFDRWKTLMKPIVNDSDEAMNPLLSKVYGDPLARSIFRARIKIISLEHLFDTSWKYGKIGNLSLGWIPKRQLLLCLDEDKIRSPTTLATPVARKSITRESDMKDSEDDKESGQSDETDATDDDDEKDEKDTEIEALHTIARKLECFELVIACMREWKLKFEYPELYSCKDVGEFLFRNTDDGEEHSSETGSNDNQAKKNCFKCLIFVARAFVTLLLFNEEKKAPPSLIQKVRDCLKIMNQRTRAHPTELARILKKKKRKEEGPKPKPVRKKKRTRTIVGNCDEREVTLMNSFALVKRESETLLKMMDYYKTRLLLLTPEKTSDGEEDEHSNSHFHRHVSFLESMDEEIVSNVKREYARERRFRKKLALAKQKGS